MAYIEDGRGLVLRFDDMDPGSRTEQESDRMIEEIQEIANRYNFKLRHWGSYTGMEKFYRNFLKLLDESKKRVQDKKQ